MTSLVEEVTRAAPSKRIRRSDFIRQQLIAEIDSMLVELGHPALVDRIFPQGWRQAADAGLASLYDLCIRTFAERARP